MKKIIIISLIMSSTFSFEVPPPYVSNENAGTNKYERIGNVEKYMNSMRDVLVEVKKDVSNSKVPKDLLKKLSEIEKNQKQLIEDFKNYKEVEYKRLELRVDFIDKEKVEKIIERFNIYKADTDRKIGILQESIKEIEALVKTVQSPYKK